MQEQASHWITLAVALALGTVFLVRNMHTKKEQRSLGQFGIMLLYKCIRLGWAIVRAIDIGYLEFRKTIAEMPLEMENERILGKLIQPKTRQQMLAESYRLEPAEN